MFCLAFAVVLSLFIVSSAIRKITLGLHQVSSNDAPSVHPFVSESTAYPRLSSCHLNRTARVTHATISTRVINVSRADQVELCYETVTPRGMESSHSPLLLGRLAYIPMRYGESPTRHIHHPNSTHDYGRREPRTSDADIDSN